MSTQQLFMLVRKCDFPLCSFETATARNGAFRSLLHRLCIRTLLNAQLTLGTVKPRIKAHCNVGSVTSSEKPKLCRKSLTSRREEPRLTSHVKAEGSKALYSMMSISNNGHETLILILFKLLRVANTIHFWHLYDKRDRNKSLPGCKPLNCPRFATAIRTAHWMNSKSKVLLSSKKRGNFSETVLRWTR